MNHGLLVATCIFACVTQVASAAGDNMYDSGAAGDVTAQMNQMWATFGRGENVRLTPFGNEPGWFEWMARKHCWSDTANKNLLSRTSGQHVSCVT